MCLHRAPSPMHGSSLQDALPNNKAVHQIWMSCGVISTENWDKFSVAKGGHNGLRAQGGLAVDRADPRCQPSSKTWALG
jgi:hypothetical protein